MMKEQLRLISKTLVALSLIVGGGMIIAPEFPDFLSFSHLLFFKILGVILIVIGIVRILSLEN